MTVLKDLDTPIFAAEGIPPNTDAKTWKIKIDGLVDKEREIGFADLAALPQTTVNARLTSVSGWSVRAEWNGVLWKDFIKAYPPDKGATHVTFASPGGYTTTVPMDELEDVHVMVCTAVGGEPLEPEYGGPVRMLIPNLWGYKSCKWVVRMTFTDNLVPGYWEVRGYTNHGEIESGITLDVNSGARKVIKGGGEVTEF